MPRENDRVVQLINLLYDEVDELGTMVSSYAEAYEKANDISHIIEELHCELKTLKVA